MADYEMERILNKIGLGACIPGFRTERISPDVVCKLSMHEMKYLGVRNSADMMKLRVKCVTYGQMGHNVQSSRAEPQYNISKQIIESLIQSGFKINEISKLLSVSKRTIYRRMSKYNVSVYSFTNIDEEALRNEVIKVTSEFPRIGETMIRQVLHQRGIKVWSHKQIYIFILYLL